MRKLIAGEFCESYPPLMDGVGQVVRNYEENLSRYFGYDVAVVTTYSTKVEMPDDGERQVIRFPMTPLKRLGAYGITRMPKDIKKRVKDIDYDIIHSHSPFSVGALGAKIARERHIPHVTTFHSQYRKDILGFTHSEFLADVGIKYLMRHYEKADAVVIPNRKSIEVLRSYGYDGDITIIENGTDMKVPSEEEKTAFRKRALTLLGLDAITKPVLLFIGQHRDEKNIPLMIESLRILKERNVDFLMVFVGDGEGRQGYIRKTAEYGLSDNVIFYGITRNREDIAAFYSLADLFLFPSPYDTSSLSTRETAAFSLPCLFIESPTSEGIEDKVNGYISEPYPEAYADYIIRILSDDSMRRIVGENARKTRYRSFYDAAKDIDELYRKLIGRQA